MTAREYERRCRVNATARRSAYRDWLVSLLAGQPLPRRVP